MLDGRRCRHLVVWIGAQAEPGFFGVHRAHLRQTARASRGILGPRVEMAGVSERGLEQELIEPVACRGSISEIRERPREGHFQQSRRRILRRLD